MNRRVGGVAGGLQSRLNGLRAAKSAYADWDRPKQVPVRRARRVGQSQSPQGDFVAAAIQPGLQSTGIFFALAPLRPAR